MKFQKKIFKTVDIVMYCVDLFVSNKRLINAYPISVRFNEFEPCLKSAKNRFQLSAGLNL